jgi:hypothetical protein
MAVCRWSKPSQQHDPSTATTAAVVYRNHPSVEKSRGLRSRLVKATERRVTTKGHSSIKRKALRLQLVVTSTEGGAEG